MKETQVIAPPARNPSSRAVELRAGSRAEQHYGFHLEVEQGVVPDEQGGGYDEQQAPEN